MTEKYPTRICDETHFNYSNDHVSSVGGGLGETTQGFWENHGKPAFFFFLLYMSCVYISQKDVKRVFGVFLELWFFFGLFLDIAALRVFRKTACFPHGVCSRCLESGEEGFAWRVGGGGEGGIDF